MSKRGPSDLNGVDRSHRFEFYAQFTKRTSASYHARKRPCSTVLSRGTRRGILHDFHARVDVSHPHFRFDKKPDEYLYLVMLNLVVCWQSTTEAPESVRKNRRLDSFRPKVHVGNIRLSCSAKRESFPFSIH